MSRSQLNCDAVICDIAERRILNERILARFEIAELRKALVVHLKGFLAVLSSNAVALIGHLGLNGVAVSVFERKADTRKGFPRIGVHLGNGQRDRLIRERGRSRDLAVIVDGKCKDLGIERISIGADRFLKGVFTCGKLLHGDFAVLVRHALIEQLAVLSVNLNGCAGDGSGSRQVGLGERDLVRFVRPFKHGGFLILGSQRNRFDLIRENEARGRGDFLDLVDTNGDFNRFGITLIVGFDGVEQFAGSVAHLKHCTRKCAVIISRIELIHSDFRFEHGVVYGTVVVLHVQFAVDGQRDFFGKHLNRFHGNGKLFEIILAMRELCRAFGNALIVGGQYLHKHLSGQVANRFSRIKPENIALGKRVVEVDLLIIELFRDLANLHAARLKLVVRLNGHGHNGSILILVGKRHGMNSIVHNVTCGCALFLH